jgi:hypothetical protein
MLRSNPYHDENGVGVIPNPFFFTFSEWEKPIKTHKKNHPSKFDGSEDGFKSSKN